MLRRIELPDLKNARLSPDAAALLTEADRRIQDFVNDPQGPLIHGFVPSDYQAVDAHLGWIVQQCLSAGNAFCEWGSGFGVVTMLAALHGFDASGLEVEPRLVEQARRLADDLAIPVQFATGSIIPEGVPTRIEDLEEFSHLDTDSPSGYEELGLEVDDFDLFFAFPWPGEERFFERLFHRCAAEGALLLTYHGRNDLRLQRRVRT